MFVYVCYCVVIGNYVFVLYRRIILKKKKNHENLLQKHFEIMASLIRFL